VDRAEKCHLEVQEYDMIATFVLSTYHAIDNLIEHFKNLGCRMSITVHFLHSHLDFFREMFAVYFIYREKIMMQKIVLEK
jgi:hypothetical protein